MGRKRERSVFWVVSTHLLTTLFMMGLLLFLLAALGLLIERAVRASPWTDLGLIVVAVGVAPAVATLHSLDYLNKVAIIARPQACIVPSIIVFSILGAGVVGLGWLSRDARSFLFLCVIAAVPTSSFAFLTARGFKKMARVVVGFEVKAVGSNEPQR